MVTSLKPISKKTCVGELRSQRVQLHYAAREYFLANLAESARIALSVILKGAPPIWKRVKSFARSEMSLARRRRGTSQFYDVDAMEKVFAKFPVP